MYPKIVLPCINNLIVFENELLWFIVYPFVEKYVANKVPCLPLKSKQQDKMQTKGYRSTHPKPSRSYPAGTQRCLNVQTTFLTFI